MKKVVEICGVKYVAVKAHDWFSCHACCFKTEKGDCSNTDRDSLSRCAETNCIYIKLGILYQCPYNNAVKCMMNEPCLGCEDFKPIEQ